jgi:recombination protein RecT
MADQKSLVKTQERDKLKTLINSQKPGILQALGKPEMVESFARAALTLVNMNEKLWDCQPESFLGALMQAAQLKLDLSLGQAWIIPYYSSKKGRTMAQFQVGYQGLIDLFYRHPLASELYAEAVFQNDAFEYSLGTSRNIMHRPSIGERGDMIAVYAVARLSTGASNIVVMSVAELHRYKSHYARVDQSGKYGVWDSDFEAMAKKTAIKQVLKYMPKAVEIQRAMINDSAIIEVKSTHTASLENANINMITDESTGYELPKQQIIDVPSEPENPESSILDKTKVKSSKDDLLEATAKRKEEIINAIEASPLTGEEKEDLLEKASFSKNITAIEHVATELELAVMKVL